MSYAQFVTERRLRRVGSQGLLFGYQGGFNPIASGATFARADASTCATYVDGNGVVQTVAANIPRYAHYVNGNGPTLLLELGQTNLLLWNRDLTKAAGAPWTLTKCSAAKDATGVDAVAASASTLTEDNTNGFHTAQQNVTKAASALAYCLSVDVKPNGETGIGLQLWDNVANGAYCNFTLTGSGSAGTPTGFGTPFTSLSARIMALTGTNAGWYRCVLTATSNTATTISGSIYLRDAVTAFTGDGVSGVRVDYVGLKQAAVQGSRIATTTVAVARTADTCYWPYLPAPQAMSILLSGYDLGSAIAGAPYWAIGVKTAITQPYLFCDANTATTSRILHQEAGQAFDVETTSYAYGDALELLGTVSGAGAVQLSWTRNGGAINTGTPSGAMALSPAWHDQFLEINSFNLASQGFLALSSLKVASQVQALQTMRGI